MGLCRVEDDYILEKLRWVIGLSNGETIYQDDDRPGEDESTAWLRLREYVKENNLSIVSFKIQFCSHVEEAAPPNADGYYFVQRVDAVAFSGSSNSTRKYYVVGALINGEIYATQWAVPEIIPVHKEMREYVENDPKLIVNSSASTTLV